MLVFLVGFTSCEPQLHELLPDPEGPPAGMVLIPAGEVTIGAPPDSDVSERSIEEGVALPQRTLELDNFYMDTHEVTLGEFLEFLEATGYISTYCWAPTNDHPVCVNYADALAYAEWAGKRLPTEFEWEKAARGGLIDKRYPWGDAEPTEALARIRTDKDVGEIENRSVPVGSYPPNGYGLYDMAGNAAEWVESQPIDGIYQLTYGGSWLTGGDWYSRVYIRERLHPIGHYSVVGFRCVKDVN